MNNNIEEQLKKIVANQLGRNVEELDMQNVKKDGQIYIQRQKDCTA